MTPDSSARETVLERLADRLAARSFPSSGPNDWPAEQFELLREGGGLRWGLPQEFGGTAISPRELLQAYMAIAQRCLTTAFVLTQRNGACQRIAASSNQTLRDRWLPSLAEGELFATVGISHLTTSRQHLQSPAVSARALPDGSFELRGEIPWVTGAPHATLLVGGGTLSDGRQLLAAIETAWPGVTVEPPLELLALSGSKTSPVRLQQVVVPPEAIVHGPVENVMQTHGNASTGALSTSALAVGHSRNALRRLMRQAEHRPELLPFVQALERECDQLGSDLVDAAEPDQCGPAGRVTEALRTRANSLALRSTQVLLATSKGAGFVQGDPAERLVREALFFLVWSCPQPVLSANLRELSFGRMLDPVNAS